MAVQFSEQILKLENHKMSELGEKFVPNPTNLP